MSSDLQALLAAIVADPSDDTARLAYADCLQEHGNDARASFIRLQIEAERLHPHSNARAALEEQALALFERHWVEWWGEVCAAVGLRRPMPEPKGRLARFALRAGVRTPPGSPYCASRSLRLISDPGAVLSVAPAAFDHAVHNRGFRAAFFRRGFPDALTVGDGAFATSWAAVAPLDAVCAEEETFGEPGPHLTGLRSLSLIRVTRQFEMWLNSPHLPRLDALHFDFPSSESPLTSSEWSRWLATPVAVRLKRLGPLEWLPDLSATLVRADLPELRALSVQTGQVPLGVLTASPLAGQLDELTVSGLSASGSAPDVFQQFHSGAWTALRKLVLLGGVSDRVLPNIVRWKLAVLDEIELMSFKLNSGALKALRQAPVLKSVRHCLLRCWTRDPKLIAGLVDVVDPNRIETFALALSGDGSTAEAKAVLERKFGDRVRFLTS